MVAQTTLAEERLARLVADPNMRTTAARWRAHAAAHPEHAGDALAEANRQGRLARDRDLARTVREMRDVLTANGSDDTDLIDYCDWMLSELEEA